MKTDQGWVLEFQHSYLKPEERRARDTFYSKLVWVVDGTRRKKDISQFSNVLKEGERISERPPLLRMKGFLDKCALLRDWADSHAPVFFDFGEEARLWWLLPNSPDGKRDYVIAFSRAEFIKLHHDGATQATQTFEEVLKSANGLVSDLNSRLPARPLDQIPPPLMKDFDYWRGRIIYARIPLSLKAVGEELAKFQKQTEPWDDGNKKLTNYQVARLRLEYSFKMKKLAAKALLPKGPKKNSPKK